MLIVEDDPDVALAARVALAAKVADLHLIESIAELRHKLAQQRFDAVLLDMNFMIGARDGHEGLSALSSIMAADRHLSVVLMTAYGGVALAVDSLKRGAADFVLKPWRNDKLGAAVVNAMELTRCKRAADILDLEAIERAAIQRALDMHGGNISLAAERLGLSRPALYRRLSKHGL